MESYNLYLFVSGFLCLWDSSSLLHVTVEVSFELCTVFLAWNVFIHFLHLTIAVCMGSFQDWAITNSAVMNILEQVSWWAYLPISVGYIPKNRVCLCSVLSDTMQQFFQVFVPIYIPTDSRWELQLLHVFTKTWCFPSFLF